MLFWVDEKYYSIWVCIIREWTAFQGNDIPWQELSGKVVWDLTGLGKFIPRLCLCYVFSYNEKSKGN